MTIASAPAFRNSAARSRKSPVAPTAAADPQTAVLVARRERMRAMLDEVPRRHQAEDRVVGVHERDLLDLAFGHQPLAIGKGQWTGVDDQPIPRRHPLRHERIVPNEAHVAPRQ